MQGLTDLIVKLNLAGSTIKHIMFNLKYVSKIFYVNYTNHDTVFGTNLPSVRKYSKINTELRIQ